MKNLKILVSAYACRPNMGSEPGVGWNTVRELGKYHKIWVLTREDNRSFIEAELSHYQTQGLNFVYLDFSGYRWWKHGLGGVHLHYYLWQIKAYLIARKLHSEIGFDIAHHVTYVRYSSPSFVSLLPIPFIWGPVGGGESTPKAFYKDFSLRSRIYELLRNLARWLGEQDPFVRLTARRSSLAWATTEDTAKRLHHIGAKNVRVRSQLGISQEELIKIDYTMPINSPIRFISVGRLLHWKGFHLGLAAFAKANLSDCEYWIVGEGPEEQQLRILTQELGISEQVKFCGSLSRNQTWSKIGHCHILVHPSLHESGGFVCLEAMALGRPVICLDLGGPAVQVTSETGFKIPAHTPEQAVDELAEAIACLAQDSELRLSMGRAGEKRVAQFFNWDIKAKSLAQLYEEIVGDRKCSGKVLA
ncbi:glycosyltransferase family 4 protein [Nostocaceae cyanobacterium CENA369]|uniref:Glycosyltransferase family 4 protein n=1 Tax=Dendronalium phyllosphericum CENA369 TaxID=1725256 RepID=A0A8J7I335_9NOST|nr:glycosyltransferase family 4 protein [Dendronalium phyllosphericum]MBH8571527.1 glycosyltransferase family 4 protein [Dendronalium phyllosphericum CENA369]